MYFDPWSRYVDGFDMCEFFESAWEIEDQNYAMAIGVISMAKEEISCKLCG